MTEYGLPFDGIVIGDASKAPYSAAEWARQWKLREGLGAAFPNYGVFAGSGNGTYQPLEVLAANPVSSNVEVQIGAGLIDGRFYETTAVVPLSVNANVAGNPRIDTVVLRLDYVLQTVRLAIKQGVAAASPARPTLQQDASFWEIPVADIAVANGFTTLAQSTISQRQRPTITAPFGWQPYAYPLVYNHAAVYGASVSLAANGSAVIIPIALAGNMLLQSVTWRGAAGVGVPSSIIGWDLYIQDVNDGNAAENTLRRVAQSNGTGSGGSGGVANNFTLDALTPTLLSPGLHWLILQNRDPANAYGIAALAAGLFTANTIRVKVFAVAGPGQTANVVASTSSQAVAPAVRLNGRVFGETTAF